MPERPLIDLVHPPPYGEVPFKHLGLCYVAAGLRASGFDTRYHDVSEQLHRAGSDFYDDLILRLSQHAGDMSDAPRLDLLTEVLFPEFGDSALATTIRAQAHETAQRLPHARAVGLSVNTLTSYFAAALGKILRNQDVIVVLGGPMMSYPPVADLFLRLDGDVYAARLFQSLLDGTPPRDVPAARWLERDTIRLNPGLGGPNLDTLPSPVFEGNVLDQFIPLQASRGCERSCVYCSESGIWEGQGVRRRSPARVLEQMDGLALEYGLRDFHFHDDYLNGHRRWFDELLQGLSHGRYSWESFFEPYALDTDRLGRIRDAGCRLIKYGIQSFSPSLLRLMKRSPDVRGIVDVVVRTYQLGISTHFDMLIGHPGETEEDHRRNLTMIEELYQRTGERLYFSINPFYLAAGSEIERHPERFHTVIITAEASDHAPPIAEALRSIGPYPVGYRSGICADSLRRRMAELSSILRRHGKDYLYLGQDRVPTVGQEPRRMLPGLDGSVPKTVRESRAAGDADLALPSIVLREDSNVRLFPDHDRISLLSAPRDQQALELALDHLPSGSTVRILGGEATLCPSLPEILLAIRQRGLSCCLETNGLRFSRSAYAQALARRGLTRATVLFLGLDARVADELAGMDGAFELAIEGARQLIAAKVSTDIGLVLSDRTVEEAHRLVELVEERLPGASGLRVVVAKLRGPNPPSLPDPNRVEEQVRALLTRARAGIRVVFEDRG